MAAVATTTATKTTVDVPVWNMNWAQQAACRGLDLDFFFEDLQAGSRKGDPYAKAREICDSCPESVRQACLATSIAEGLRSGFFGGAIPARRIELRKHAQQAGVDVASARDIATYLASR
jgi:Transcription factor WhiB